MISIIIPIYNVADYILDCLNSVLSQEYSDIEVILVNDCTPDSSMEIAMNFIPLLQEKFRVQIINHKQNQGLSAARNSGVRVATGEWLYFLDSDDEISPNAMCLFADAITDYPNADFYIGAMQPIGGNTNCRLTSRRYIQGNAHIQKDYLLGKWYEMACNKVISKNFFLSNNLWFKEGLIHEDQLFSFQLATTAHSMTVVNEITYFYKIRNSGSITSTKKSKSYEAYFIILNEMVKYLYEKQRKNRLVYEYELTLRFVYSFLLNICGNQILNRDEATLYIKKIDVLWKSVSIKKRIMPLKIFYKYCVLLLPLRIRFKLLAWHYNQILHS